MHSSPNIAACIACVATLLTAAHALAQDPTPSHKTRPVLLELFTSQGCSSCPAADETIAKLAVADPNLIVLTFHVDYWDDLGWKDPYSSPLWSKRQSTYARTLRERRLYTPQAIVQGQEHAVGSHRSTVEAMIQNARSTPDPTTWSTRVKPTAEGGWYVETSARTLSQTPLPSSIQIVAALVDVQGDSTRIPRGENTGRTLRNTHTVHKLRTLQPTRTGSLLHAAWSWTPPKNVPKKNAHLVLFLQDTKTLKVLSVTHQPLQKK